MTLSVLGISCVLPGVISFGPGTDMGDGSCALVLRLSGDFGDMMREVGCGCGVVVVGSGSGDEQIQGGSRLGLLTN